MINSIKLKNFRKHTDLNLDFASGFSLFRADNEAGKSTVVEAICYALLGSKALRSSIDSTVTHGSNVSTLKVEISLTVEGSAIRITRTKGAAEMFVDGELSCTGQADVSAAVCKLLGVEPKHLTSLMVAEQGGIRGLLSEGALADKTINSLANLDGLDVLIEHVQKKYDLPPSRFSQQQIDELNDKLAQPSVEAPSQEALQAAIKNEARAAATLKAATDEHAALDVQGATAAIAQHKQAVEHNARSASLKAKADAMAKPQAPEQDRDRVIELRLAVEREKEVASLVVTYQDAPPTPATFVSAEVFHANLEQSLAHLRELQGKEQALRSQLQIAAALRIDETTCKLCGKDVGDVPEVVERNAASAQKTQKLQVELDALRLELTHAIQAAQEQEKQAQLARRARKYVHPWVAQGTIPETYRWEGAAPVASPSRLAEMKELTAQWAAYDEELAEWQEFQRNYATVELLPVLDVSWADALLAQSKALAAQTSEKRSALDSARSAMKLEADNYNNLRMAHEKSQALRQAWREQKATLEISRDASRKVEALVKKLRDLRPVLATKVWTAVLASISHFFSQVRSAPSPVTRDEDGFKVDGLSIAALSGSTLDALGLSLRLALLRVFCPAANWVILDEAAAACDVERELAMLGMLKSAGFEQVLLVSHSDAGDAVADQLVSF